MQQRNRQKKYFCLFLVFIMIVSFYASASATLISFGYISAVIPIENRTTYDWQEAEDAWYYTSTPANIYGVPGNTHSWMIDGQYATSWQGLYTCIFREYIFWGRATEFSIKLNRNYLLYCTYEERVWTMVHELGHALSQDDNPSNNTTPDESVMNYGCNRQNYFPRQYDEDGVNAAY